MGHLELCRIMDQHEFVYSNVYAGQFADWRRNELVAGHPDYIFGKYNCADSDDSERACRREIRYSVSGVCTGQFRNQRGQYSSTASGIGGLRLVWHSNMDWR